MLTFLFLHCCKYVESGTARSALVSAGLSSEAFMPFLKGWGKDGGTSRSSCQALPCFQVVWRESHPCLAPDWEGLLKLDRAWRNLLWRIGGKHIVLLCSQLMIEKVAVSQLLSAALQKWPSSLVIYPSYQVFTLTVFHGDHWLFQLLAQLYCHLPSPSLPAFQCLPERAGSELLHHPSSTFPVVFGGQCCVAWFGLHCRQLKWWFVSL